MTTSPQSRFYRRYGAALRRHVRQQPRAPASLRGAKLLGSVALALGLDTEALARVHDRALADLAPAPGGSGGRKGEGQTTPAGRFFLAALSPLERTHHAALVAAQQARQLKVRLRLRTTALAGVRLRMRRELARQRKDKATLKQGAHQYSLLLARTRRMQKESRRLAHQVLLAQEEERKEISRGLHDEVAQILVGINVQLAALKVAAALNSRNLQHRITLAQRLVERSVQVVHRYARELRPALLDDLGLIPALRSYIKDMPGRKGLHIHFRAFPAVENFDSLRRTVFYRVAQEALTNIARHARAQTVSVILHPMAEGARLEVRDDGQSFPVDRLLSSRSSKRLGLLGMQERVKMVGGALTILSAPGKGTLVRAEIPYRGTRRKVL